MASRLVRDIAGEFVRHYQIHAADARTMPSQMRVLLRHFGELAVDDVSIVEVESYVSARLSEGISGPTLNRQASVLSVFFKWAILRGYRTKASPVVGLRRFKESDPPERYLTPDEAGRLILATKPHARPVIITALHTGGRSEEIFALRCSAVDLSARILTFLRSTTKGKRKSRHIPMSPTLQSCLLPLIAGRAPDDHVFTYRDRRMHDIRSSFETARAKAGLGSDVNFKTLRHTFASWYMINGGAVRVLQQLLGHRSVKTTERYAHLSREYVDDSVKFIGPPARRERESDPLA